MEKKHQRYNKRKFLITFAIVMGLFAVARHALSVDIPLKASEEDVDEQYLDEEGLVNNSDWANMEMEGELGEHATEEDYLIDDESLIASGEAIYDEEQALAMSESTEEFSDTTNNDDNTSTEGEKKDSSARKHNKIKGVYSYDKCFPDINDVQLEAAKKHGITPVKSRKSAERLVRNRTLVNISHSPFYKLDNLTHSMPYLVPRAQQLLNTISVNFIDSCQAKGVPVHLPMVTSVLRTSNDVAKLQRGNKNATTNSCHCYGTTVDISYVKFVPVIGHHDPNQPLTRWDEPLKRILSEVLYDLRDQNKCYVKYERKQACFHLTCR